MATSSPNARSGLEVLVCRVMKEACGRGGVAGAERLIAGLVDGKLDLVLYYTTRAWMSGGPAPAGSFTRFVECQPIRIPRPALSFWGPIVPARRSRRRCSRRSV